MFCRKCGFRTDIYLMEPPPKIRITKRLAVILFIAGLTLHLILEYILPFILHDVPEEYLMAIIILDDLLALPLIAVSLVFYLAYISKVRLKPWLIDVATAIGFLLNIVIFFLLKQIGSGPLFDILYYLRYPFSYALILVGIFSRKLIDKEIDSLNIEVEHTRYENLLAAITILVPLLFFASYGSTSLRIYIGMPTIGLATWLIWDIFSTKLVKIYVFKNLSGRKEEWMEVVRLEDKVKERGLRPHFIDMLLDSFTLTLLTYSIIVLGLELVPVVEVDTASVEGLANTVQYSWILLILLSILVGPSQWLFDALDLRIYNKKVMIVEKASPFRYLDEFIDVFALLGFLLTIRNVSYKVTGGKNMFGFSKIYFASQTALFLFILYWLSMLTPSLLATLLYYKFSITRHVSEVLRELKPRSIEEIIGEKAI